MNATISLAMIVRDSAKTLDKCLAGFKDVVDEMVIVDTGSVDDTVQIARRYTDNVLFFKWINDFSAARNYSFSKCTKEMIFWADSDDYILPEDAAKVRAYDYAGKNVIICQYHYAHDEFGVTRLIVPRERIIRRSLGMKWQKRIHEYLPIVGVNGQHISNIVTHHDKQHGTSERNLAILEQIVKEDNDTRDVYYLGKELIDFGRVDEGLKYLHDFVGRKDWFWEDLYQAHYIMALAYLNKKDDDGFFRHMFQSIRIEPRRAEPYYQLGFYHHMRNEWSRAIQWYETCLTVKRPAELLGGYLPEYYTWLPCLQLAVCHNAVGNIEAARDYNKRVLEMRPGDQRAVNNEQILGGAVVRKKVDARKDFAGASLALRPGKDPEPDDLPYKDGTVGNLAVENVLERLPFARVDASVKEFFRVLRPGGDVTLFMPDLEGCARRYFEAPVEARRPEDTKAWFRGTIYGKQKTTDEVHRSGFSKAEMTALMERNGFIVDYCENYGGPGQRQDHGIPSFGMRAVKPVSQLKVGWIAPMNWDAAQTRIRVLNVHRWLKSRGYRSDVVNYPDIINKGYDVAVVGKAFDENHYKNVKWLKRQGKTVIADLCEDLMGGQWPWVHEILAACDKVVCCSDALADKVRPVNPNVEVIEDAWEA